MPHPTEIISPDAVLAILNCHVGREHAIKAKIVANMLERGSGQHMSRGDRAVGLAVAELRERNDLNAVIASGDCGYYIAETPEEADVCIGRLQKKAGSLLGIIRALEQGRARAFGDSAQLELGL